MSLFPPHGGRVPGLPCRRPRPQQPRVCISPIPCPFCPFSFSLPLTLVIFLPPVFSIELTANVLRCPIYIDRNGGREGGRRRVCLFISVSARDFPVEMGEKIPTNWESLLFSPVVLLFCPLFPLLSVTRRPRRRRRPSSGGGGRPPRRTETKTFA